MYNIVLLGGSGLHGVQLRKGELEQGTDYAEGSQAKRVKGKRNRQQTKRLGGAGKLGMMIFPGEMDEVWK